MIATIPEDIFFSFVLGLSLALSAAPMLKKEESLINTYFIRALLFQVLVFFPLGLFLAKYWTAWSWMYFINPHNHSKFWTFLAVFGYIPSMIAGFHIAYLCIRTDKRSHVYWYMAFGILGLALFTFPLLGRLYHIQNDWLPADQIHTAETWFQSGWFMLAMGIWGAYFFGALVYVLRLNRADRRRLARKDFSRPIDVAPETT